MRKEKVSKQGRVNLCLDPLPYHILCIAAGHYMNDKGEHVSKSDLARIAVLAVSSEVLKKEGIYEKTVNDFMMSATGKQILEGKQDVEVKDGELLP